MTVSQFIRSKGMYGEVKDVTTISPSMVRIVLGGNGLEDFSPTGFTDQYINAYFIPENASYSRHLTWKRPAL